MKQFLFLLFCLCLVENAIGQTTYVEAMQQGDTAFKNGQYRLAIAKYFAAEAIDPAKKRIVKEKVNLIFDKIEALRQEAINSKKEAEAALKEAEKQTQIANNAKKEVEAALTKAQEQQVIAEKERQNAIDNANETQKALNKIQGFLNKDVGKKFQGGIIFYSDSTREHGLIAAEYDLANSPDSLFTWEEAKKACEDYSVIVDGVTYDDWFLPSKDTLALLYVNKDKVGSFANYSYWSSSEDKNYKGGAWVQGFGGGGQGDGDKSYRAYVRPVRAF